MEHWGGFTDVELNSLRQRGRGRRAVRRSRGPPFNQGARKVVYPIGRGESISNNGGIYLQMPFSLTKHNPLAIISRLKVMLKEQLMGSKKAVLLKKMNLL